MLLKVARVILGQCGLRLPLKPTYSKGIHFLHLGPNPRTVRLKTQSPPVPLNSGAQDVYNYWAHALEHHAPHPTNDGKVTETRRFGHVLTVVLDGTQFLDFERPSNSGRNELEYVALRSHLNWETNLKATFRGYIESCTPPHK